jgi:hypothetical protein
MYEQSQQVESEVLVTSRAFRLPPRMNPGRSVINFGPQERLHDDKVK